MPRTTTTHRRLPIRTLAVAATIAFCLAACGPTHDPAPSTDTSTPAASASATNDDAADVAKLNAYVRVHDVLVNGGGFASARADYERALIDAQRNSGPGLSTGWIERAADELRQAQALPSSGFPELSLASDTLLKAIEPLRQDLEPLVAYFSARRYIEDHGATAVSRKKEMLAAYDAAASAQQAFDVALDHVTEARSAQRLERLKSGSDVLAYDMALSMARAKTLFRAIKTSAGASGAGAAPRPVAKSRPPFDATAPDAALKSLEEALDSARQEIARRKAAQTPEGDGPPYREQASAIDALTDMAGRYRGFRASGSQSDSRGIVMSYNNAIEYYNRIPTVTYRRVKN